MIRFLLLFLSIVLTLSNSIFHLYKHPSTSAAKCLDGSPAALYFSEATDTSAKDKFLVFFEGGSSCMGSTLSNVLDDCVKRTKNHLGSSDKYIDKPNYENVSLLSGNKTINPLYYGWNRVFIKYCDGSLHQGSRAAPVSYKDLQLYFRGANNTLEHFNYLNLTYQIFRSSRIVLAGYDAGAQAVYYWSDYFQSISEQAKILAIADSGIFASDFVNPFTNRTDVIVYFKPLFNLVNDEIDMPNKACAQRYGKSGQIDCFLAGKLAEFIQVPIFIIQSGYDTWALQNVLGLNCVPNGQGVPLTTCSVKESEAILKYRKYAHEAMRNFTNSSTNHNVGNK